MVFICAYVPIACQASIASRHMLKKAARPPIYPTIIIGEAICPIKQLCEWKFWYQLGELY